MLAVLLVLAGGFGLIMQNRIAEHSNAVTAVALVNKLFAAKVEKVPEIVAEMEPYRAWTDPLLRQEIAQPHASASQRLHASLALLPLAVLSSLAGVKLVRRVPAERFYTLVYWLMIIAGAKLLLDGFKIS